MRPLLSLAAFVAVFAVVPHDAPPIAPTAALAFFGAGLVAGSALTFAALFDVLRTGGSVGRERRGATGHARSGAP